MSVSEEAYHLVGEDGVLSKQVWKRVVWLGYIKQQPAIPCRRIDSASPGSKVGGQEDGVGIIPYLRGMADDGSSGLSSVATF